MDHSHALLWGWGCKLFLDHCCNSIYDVLYMEITCLLKCDLLFYSKNVCFLHCSCEPSLTY